MPGKARLDWNDKKVQRNLTNLLMRNSRAAGRHTQRETKPATSRRGRPRPGAPPGGRSGRLFKSIRQVVVRSRSRGTITIRIGSGNFKARFLELGTKAMGERPFLFPIFKKSVRRMVAILLKGRR